MNCPVSGKNIFRLIPQRPPFVMIDTLFSASEKYAETGFTIPDGHIFVHNGLFREPGLIENIAQSAAAMTGFMEYSSNQEAKVGFIGAIKNLKINKLPKPGQSIKTQIVFIDQIMEFMIISGKIFNDSDIFAECEMQIFITS